MFKWANYLLKKLFSLGSEKDLDAYYFIKVSTTQKISFNRVFNFGTGTYIFFNGHRNGHVGSGIVRNIYRSGTFFKNLSLLIERFVFRIFRELNSEKLLLLSLGHAAGDSQSGGAL